MYTCIIIDDEPHAADGLKKYIDSIPNLQIVACYENSVQALNEIKKSIPVDLIFLDIDMPYINGIELAKEIRYQTNKLVFTTGHTKYGYDAFKANADDYLLKPYTLGEFIISIEKLLPQNKILEKSEQKNFFFVRSRDDNGKIISIKYSEVVLIESKLNYVTIYTLTKKVTTYISLTEMFRILANQRGFLQFHRSYIIAQDHIEYLEGNSIKMTNGVIITVRDYYKKSFTDFLAKMIIKAGQHDRPR